MSKNPIGLIVSSAHLAAEGAAELSEFEFGLTLANNAFHRWMVRCMTAAGVPDLSPLDILVMHSVYHRGRAKKLPDLCLVLNVDDSHLISYALKKLVKQGLVKGEKRGKENLFSVTPKGRDAVLRYRDIREKCLTESLGLLGTKNAQISEMAGLMRALSGLYDQAARAATSL